MVINHVSKSWDDPPSVTMINPWVFKLVMRHAIFAQDEFHGRCASSASVQATGVAAS